jgi:ligand-binding SRPBCC domain-containing protein
MQHFEHSIHVDAPVQHVWDFYFDTSHWQDWMPRMSYLGDFSGPLDQVGTTYVGAVRWMGHEFKATYKVIEVVPQELYHEHGDMGPQDNRMRFEPEGDGTLVTIESDYEMPRLPKVLQDLMSKSFMERQMIQMLGDFKAIAEATVPVAV